MIELIDIFSYSCMNCRRSLKYITKLYAQYRRYGLKVRLVHPPEWEFEKDADNISHAVNLLNINFPVEIDRDKKLIKRFNVNFWPAQMLISSNKAIYKHVGDGNYKELERSIIKALNINPPKVFTTEPKYTKLPTVYLGKNKKGIIGRCNFGSVACKGNYSQEDEYLFLDGTMTTLTKGRKFYIVAESKPPCTATIRIGEGPKRKININRPNLYFLYQSRNSKPHKLIISGKLKIYSLAFE